MNKTLQQITTVSCVCENVTIEAIGAPITCVAATATIVRKALGRLSPCPKRVLFKTRMAGRLTSSIGRIA
jgi:hypothetical protein